MKYLKKVEKYELALIVLVGIALSFVLRYSLRGYKSVDFDEIIFYWYTRVINRGPVRALRTDLSNYTPFYTYMMIIASYLFREAPKHVALKFLNFPFDYIIAIFTYKTVKLKYPTGNVAIFAFFAVLFLPTLFLVSAFWGQIDSMYVAGMVACLYFLANKKEGPAFISYGLAFSIKLQSIFMFPLLVILFLRRYVSWKSFFIIPLIYLAVIFPAWLAGRPIQDLLKIYFLQANLYPALTQHAPNFYQWISNDLYKYFFVPGVIFAGCVVFLFIAGAYLSKVTIDKDVIVSLSLISVLLLPYTLPKMHDRYFLAADLMAIIFAFYFPRYFFIPIAVGAASFFSYFPFLLGYEAVPETNLAALLAVVIVVVIYQFARLVIEKRSQEQDPNYAL